MKKIMALLAICLGMTAGAQQLDTGTISRASGLVDLRFSSAEKDSMLDRLKTRLSLYEKMHSLDLPNSQPYPFAFNPLPSGYTLPTKQSPVSWNIPGNVLLPVDKNELAFFSIPQLASLIKNKKISSVELPGSSWNV